MRLISVRYDPAQSSVCVMGTIGYTGLSVKLEDIKESFSRSEQWVRRGVHFVRGSSTEPLCCPFGPS